MGDSRTKRSVNNTISSLIFQFVTILLGFLVQHFMLTTFGKALYGTAGVIGQITDYFALVEAGLGTATIQALYKPLANKDWSGVSGILSASKKFYNQTGHIFTVMVLGLTVIFPFVGVKDNDKIDPLIVGGLVLVMGMGSALEYYIGSRYRTLLMADQKVGVVNNIKTIGMIISSALRIALILLGVDIVFVYFVTTLLYLSRSTAMMIYVKKKYKHIDYNAKPNTKALHKRWSALMHQFAGMVVNNTDAILINFFKGPSMAAVYFAYNYAFRQLYTIMTSTFSVATAAVFGHMVERNEMTVVRSGHKLYELLYYNVVSVIYSTTALMILPFVTLFSGGKVPANDITLAVLFVAIGVANNLRVPCGTLITAAGHFKETQTRALIEAGINLVVSLALVVPLGLQGVLIGTVVSFSYRTIDILLYTNKYILKQSPAGTLIRAVRTIAVIGGTILLFTLVLPLESLYNTLIAGGTGKWISWFLTAFIAGIGSLITSLSVNFLFEFSVMKKIFSKIISATFKSKKAI